MSSDLVRRNLGVSTRTSVRTCPQGERAHNHPSLHCYKKHGCRCNGCRRFNAAQAARQRARNPMLRRYGYRDEDTGLWVDAPTRTHADWVALRLLTGI